MFKIIVVISVFLITVFVGLLYFFYVEQKKELRSVQDKINTLEDNLQIYRKSQDQKMVNLREELEKKDRLLVQVKGEMKSQFKEIMEFIGKIIPLIERLKDDNKIFRKQIKEKQDEQAFAIKMLEKNVELSHKEIKNMAKEFNDNHVSLNLLLEQIDKKLSEENDNKAVDVDLKIKRFSREDLGF